MPPGPPIARNFILIVDPSLNFSLNSSPNGDKDATATAFIVGTVPKRTLGDHCGIGERLSCASALPAMRLGSTGPDMTLVSLLNDTQRDIGEQGREHSPYAKGNFPRSGYPRSAVGTAARRRAEEPQRSGCNAE